jgi:hypothetical protein
MKGTLVFFQSRVPTRWEIENCRTIELTQDHLWNPNEVNKAKVTTKYQKDDIESETYRQVCAFTKLLCVINGVNDCKCQSNIDSGLSVFDEHIMIPRMVSSVKVATAFRETRTIAFVGAKDCHSQVNAETIARRFCCRLETTHQTLKSTTQRGVCQSLHPLHRRYPVDHLDLHRKLLQETFYTDTLFSKVKSLAGYRCAQLITNG